jgi:hypothetical protein
MNKFLIDSGDESLSFGEWNTINEYDSGDTVIKDGGVWIANSDIAANSPFNIGSTGATWRQVITPVDSSVRNIPIMISESASGTYGRLHAYGNRIYTAGANDSGGYGNLYGIGYNQQIRGSKELPCIDPLPDSWKKIHDIRGNFYGLGSNGVLYVCGSNAFGNLGIGEDLPGTRVIIMNTHPSLFGSGIEVLDFWATTIMSETSSFAASCWVQVRDNGVLKLYGFGINRRGLLGTGVASSSQHVPFEYVEFRDVPIKKIVSWFGDGDGYTLLVTQSGQLWASGRDGALGTDDGSDRSSFIRSMSAPGVPVQGAVDCDISVAQGSWHNSYVLLSDGTVMASGRNSDRQLGDGTTTASTYFTYVLKAPNTPINKITAISGTGLGVAALDSDGMVWMTGRNNDGVWGNGQANSAVGDVYATIKQGNVAAMWFNRNGRFWNSAWWLRRDNTLWASGGNFYTCLGISSNTDNPRTSIAARVPLPEGEYPVQFRWCGGNQWNGSSYPLIGAGAVMVTNKNKLYVAGKPFASIDSIKGANDGVPFFHHITDFYDKRKL